MLHKKQFVNGKPKINYIMFHPNSFFFSLSIHFTLLIWYYGSKITFIVRSFHFNAHISGTVNVCDFRMEMERAKENAHSLTH